MMAKMTPWTFSLFLSGLASAPLCDLWLFAVTLRFSAQKGFFVLGILKKAYLHGKLIIISQPREKLYVGSKYWDPAKADAPCL